MVSDVHHSRQVAGVTVMCAALTLAIACSTKSSGNSGGGTCASPGAATSGPQDNHCDTDAGPTIQVVDPSACTGPLPDAGSGDDGGAAGDDGGGASDGGVTCLAGYNATMFNQSGADDDCKYDVSWTSTPICEGQPVYFTVTAKYRVDGTPVTGANPTPDVVLNCLHPSPNNPHYAEPSPETSPGTYTVGPIVFDQPGRWVFRFHYFGTCNDVPQSPHGHSAFYIDVP